MKKVCASCFWVVFSIFIASTAYAASAHAPTQSMAAKTILTRGEGSMKTTIERMKSALAFFPTGACVELLEGLRVETNGAMTPLSRLANISTPNAKTIEIRPGDVSQLPAIAKTIAKSNIGLTADNDGKIIRIPVPSLTEERRKDIIKSIQKITEEFRIAIRNERRGMHENILKADKDKKITEEERREAEEELEKLTDAYMKKIDEMLDEKEKEIMDV